MLCCCEFNTWLTSLAAGAFSLPWEKGAAGSHRHSLTPLHGWLGLGNCAGSEKWVQSLGPLKSCSNSWQFSSVVSNIPWWNFYFLASRKDKNSLQRMKHIQRSYLTSHYEEKGFFWEGNLRDMLRGLELEVGRHISVAAQEERHWCSGTGQQRSGSENLWTAAQKVQWSRGEFLL